MSKQKGDQTGERIKPKHVFANPYEPVLCPVLAIALHVFSITFRADNDEKSKLFLGSPYDVCTKWLPTALNRIGDLGYDVKDFGTHSFRKGIADFSSGFMNGPSVLAIFLRAGWSLGQVQDRYFSSAGGNDHLCGRVAAGLDFNSGSRFSVLPPHFANADVISREQWQHICPCYHEFPVGFRACLPYFLASLAYHYDWIVALDSNGNYLHLAKEHPFFQSRVFTSGLLPDLKSLVISNVISGRCDITGMTATGVPPHIKLHRKLDRAKKEIVKLKKLIVKNQKELLTKMPKKVTKNIMANVRIEGVQQVSRNELADIFDTAFDRRFPQGITSVGPVQVPNAAVAEEQDNLFRVWSWGGMFHPVPENWDFPTGNVKSICDMFVFGIPALRIRPFRLISSKSLARSDQSNFSKADFVFKTLMGNVYHQGLLSDETALRDITFELWDKVFSEIFGQVINAIEVFHEKKIRKAGEISIITMYDKIRRYNKAVDLISSV